MIGALSSEGESGGGVGSCAALRHREHVAVLRAPLGLLLPPGFDARIVRAGTRAAIFDETGHVQERKLGF